MSRDFEYTDWDDLRTFVNEFADAHEARLKELAERTG